MASLMFLPSKQGGVVLFANDILALTEGRSGTTDVYTSIFPQGITIDIPMDEFVPQFISALNGEEEDDDGSIDITFKPDQAFH